MSTSSMDSPHARERRASKYRQAVVEFSKAKARLADNPTDAAAKAAVERTALFLKLATSALQFAGDPIPQSAPPSSAGVPAPAPAAPAACTPSRAAGSGLTLANAEAIVAAVEQERNRSAAIVAEADALGIARQDVDAALASKMTAEQFVERYAPAEALARQIAKSADCAY